MTPRYTPEQQARIEIDRQLEAAGWAVQDRERMNLFAGRGVAVREFPLRTGVADYLLCVDGEAIGAVEAKKAGTTLSGVHHQSQKYSVGLPDLPRAWRRPLPFLYEGAGLETCFTYDELIARDKVNLDIFWLRDESLEDTANLPDPDVLALEIVEDLQAALEQFSEIAEDLEPTDGSG